MSVSIASPSYPSLPRARYAQLVLALVGLFGAMDTQVLGLLVEPIKHELLLSDVQVGLAYGAAYFAAYALLAVPAGMLVDRLSRVRLLLAAMILNCGGLMLTALSHSLAILILSKVISGIAMAIKYPAALSLLSDYFPPERRAFGSLSYGIGQQFGNVAALMVGGLGYTALVNLAAADPGILGGVQPWRLVSLIFATVGIVIIPLLIAMREPARMEIGQAGQGSFRELWDYRRFLVPLFVALMCMSGAAAGFATWYAAAVMRLYKLQPGDFAVAASAITVGCGLLSVAVTGKLINMARARGGNRALILPAAVAALLAVPCTAMGMMPNALGFAALSTLYMFLNGIAIAIPVIAINFQIPNELRGLCMGSYVVLLALAAMIGAPLVGFVGKLLGGDMMIGYGIAAVAAPLAGIAALCFWLASRTGDEAAMPETGSRKG